jgi:hypothetical protein
MKEFMFLIRNKPEGKSVLTTERKNEFLRKCENYIKRLKKEGKLISAQPLLNDGKIISGSTENWMEFSYNETSEVQVGYYHIFAKDLDEAIAIAKENPEFEYTKNARIEVRPIKTKEEKTGFIYPKNLKST